MTQKQYFIYIYIYVFLCVYDPPPPKKKKNIYIYIEYSTYDIIYIYIGLTPFPVIVEMKVYRDPLLKIVHNPGGDCYYPSKNITDF